ncbi:MAG: ABC transporter permease [Lachnospiraceae bacterium]|nr:ABC transporter permease [Lachnospiraceae bacterium]
MSGEMKSFGGFSHASGRDVKQAYGGFMVNAPIIILDDNSFLTYCEQIGISPRLDGAVVRNRIRDVTNQDFRHPDFMPYIKEKGSAENPSSTLRQSGNEKVTARIPVLSYAEKVPASREEYATLDYYELVHFLPVSLGKEIKAQIGGWEENTCICILGEENITPVKLDALEGETKQLLGAKYEIECENHIRKYEINNRQIQGMMAVLGGFCILLALIGIGNVFSNTVGFVHQRKREFARYMSVGVTPAGIRKIFCIEALILAGRPIQFTLPLAVAAVGYMLKLRYLEVGVFMADAPFLPVIAFMLAALGSVAFAYYLAWRNVRKISLAQVLRDDTMM